MEKHSWMIEVIDDLAFYAVSNGLVEISSGLKEVRKSLMDGNREPGTNVVNFDLLARRAR